jgi:hypothetical protein
MGNMVINCSHQRSLKNYGMTQSEKYLTDRFFYKAIIFQLFWLVFQTVIISDNRFKLI